MDEMTERTAPWGAPWPQDPRVRGLLRALVDRRQVLRLSQTEVAARMGTSQSAVARLEAGEADPRISTLERYAEAIDAELLQVVRTTFGRAAVPPAGLVTADDLEQWAGEITSQSELAELIRRLIRATAGGVSELRFPTHAGVQQGGWDGIATVKHGNPYIAAGRSVWELGTGGDIKKKAEEDLAKRSKDPLGVDPSGTTFVVVSLRRWRSKPDSGTWARQNQVAGPWRGIRVLDADDLAAWLELAPAVHYWLSERRGKMPKAARPLEMWWDDWSGATAPPVAAALVVVGRSDAEQELGNHLDGPPGTLTIRAESRDEALAFVAATVKRLPGAQRDATLPRCLVVTDERGWRHAVASDNGLVLVPQFEGVTLTADVASRHHVVIPVGNEVALMPGTIELPRLDRELAEAALKDILEDQASNHPRFTQEDAASLSLIARRSLLSLRRRLAVSRTLERPSWASQSDVWAVAPLVLVGGWQETKDGDKEVVARLVGHAYNELARELRRLGQRDDPLIRRVGDTWYVVDREDAWMLLAPHLTDSDIQQFADVVRDVLGAPLPATELPPEEQWRAPLLDLVPKESETLREALAETLALMGSRSDVVELCGGHHGQRIADGIVSRLVTAANDDESGRLWASLSNLLPLLAEAAPDVFLGAVDGASSSDRSMVQLFTDAPDRDPMFTNSPHTGLLWALETLAWSPEYVGRVAHIVARLAKIDPGGRLSNRPNASLRQIFLPWHPQTAASVDERLAVIDGLFKHFPDIGWNLAVALLPRNHDWAMPTHPPRYRDWKPSQQPPVTFAELDMVAEQLVRRMLRAAGKNGARWAALIPCISALPAQLRDGVLDEMEHLNVELFEDGTVVFRDALREETARHRKHANAEWALPKATADRLAALHERVAAGDRAQDASWLFTQRPPSLPNVDEEHLDWQAYQGAVDDRRGDVVRSIYRHQGLAGLRALAEAVEVPSEVGRVAGERQLLPDQDEQLMFDHLVAESPALEALARGYVFGRFGADGMPWAEPLVAQASEWPAERRAALLLGFPSGEQTWKLAERFGERTEALYWKRALTWTAPDDDFAYATEKLLRHGRPHHAIDLLAHRVHSGKVVDSDLIFRALKQSATTEPSTSLDSTFAYDVGRLLDYLGDLDDVDEDQLAQVELIYVNVLRFSRPSRLLHKRLAANPEEFAEIITWVFKPEGGETWEVTDEVRARAHLAYGLLDSWEGIPGLRPDGTIDSQALEEWASDAQRLCAEKARRTMGEQYIGRALAHAPRRDDEVWPPEEICGVLDRPEFNQMRRGFEIEVYNTRGVTTRGLTDGGMQERALAQRYSSWASQLASRWPRVASLLRRIADHYIAEAEREDVEAQLRQDRGW